MKLITMLIALMALVTACVYAAAVPDPSTKDIAKRQDNLTSPALDPQVMDSLSTWFGWQLAGAAKDQNELAKGCQDINSIGGKRWERLGLVTEKMRDILCNASYSNPNPHDAFPNSIPFISDIIRRQLVGSFIGGDGTFAYLCDNLAFFQINQFYLTDTRLLAAVCKKAGKQVPPRPFGEAAGSPISEAAAYAAKNTASKLYATILAAGAESDVELNVLCAHAPEHTDNLNAETLNGTLVESTLCLYPEQHKVGWSGYQILALSSRLFTTVLENIGKVASDEWLKWLCVHLDEEGMNGVGLYGAGVSQLICEDAKNGLPTEIEIPQGIPCNVTELM